MAEAEVLTRLASRFSLPGRLQTITPLGEGLINETWLVTTDQSRAVLQRINTSVFPHPQWNMANLRRVVNHLAGKTDLTLHLPSPIPSCAGTDWAESNGQFWRMLEFIEGMTLKRIDSLERAKALGWSLGRLHRLLADLDPAGFHDTLPGFHVTRRYLREFDCAIAAWRGRIDSDLGFALDFIAQHRDRAGVLESSRLPLRVVHGDPKLDNVVFDARDGRPLAWLDLDTLKPGSVLYDIGDCVRSACGQEGRFDLDRAEAVFAGWFEEAVRFLTASEVGQVTNAVWLLPFELGLRFLSDYLAGNRYFRVEHPRQNLQRALDQLFLAQDIDQQSIRLERMWKAISAAPGR